MTHFEMFRDNYCKHYGGPVRIMIDGEVVPGCAYKNGQATKTWEGMQECKLDNCSYFHKYKIERRG